MENILIHGLGQTNQSWNEVSGYLRKNGIETVCVNLFEITPRDFNDYKAMYHAFSTFCNNQNGKLNLCGLSFILIGTPYKIPKVLFKFQNLIFKIMPKSTFEKMGCSKKEFITLVNSMNDLDIVKSLEKINCRSLILCGVKDNVNMKSAELLKKNIKNSQFKVISNSGHEVNRDNPKELADEIFVFWQD